MMECHFHGQAYKTLWLPPSLTGVICSGDSGCHLVRKLKQLNGEGTGASCPQPHPCATSGMDLVSSPVKPSDDHHSRLTS